MKNVDLNLKNSIKNASSALLVALLMVVSYTAQADIIGLTASINGGYQPGTTSTIMVDVTFDSSTAESADFIEFSIASPIAGLTISHGLPSPSPYQGCGLNKGMEMIGAGPGWGTPMMMAGNSQCGAFEGNQTHTFGIEIVSDGTFTGSFGIAVTVIGDGVGESGASGEVQEVLVQPILCMLLCPDAITLTASGDCSIQVNVPAPTSSGMCDATPPGLTDEFAVGTTPVTYISSDENGNVISCVTMVTILDDEDPVVLGVTNIEEDLGSGGCGFIIPQTFTINENCIEPTIMITQSNDLGNFDSGYNCVGGPTSYLRVFDAAMEGVNTELNIEEVTFGVLESFGSPYVTVNVYRLNGTPTYANMELIGTGGEVIPNFENALYSIPVSAVVAADETFVVEIVVPGSQFNGIIMAMNQNGETAPSYIASAFCVIPEPVTTEILGFPGYGIVMSLEGYQTSYVISPVGNSPMIGDTAFIGVTQVSLIAIDASGNEANIDFTVTVNEIDDFITAIVCNDEIQISLQDDCMAIIGADQILEGGPYGCYDSYIVEIEDENGNNFGDTVTEENIGQTLTVRVTGPNGNSCWGSLVVQDKLAPQLECLEVFTSCNGDIFPGSPIADNVTFPANLNMFNSVIDANAVSSNDFTFNVRGLVRSTITKIAVRLNIQHEAVSDLSATLVGPDGTTVTLFVAPGTDCTEDNIQITLDDMAFNTYTSLEDTCSTDMTNAISGSFQPLQLLNIFNGQDPNGDWTLTITDGKAGDGGSVVAAELVVSQEGGIVTFPTQNDVVFQTEGNNVFTVLGIDACGSATMSFNDDELEQDCSSPYSKVILRTWSAEDESGNVTEGGCVQTIYVFRNGLATLMFPPNFDDLQEPSLSCELYANDAPPTSVTGAPSGDLCDNVQIFPFTDTRIDICEGSYKLIRHFQLLEWCSGEVVEHNQIIKVLDKEGPEIVEPVDITISAGEITCTADFVAPFPEVTSDCSDEFTYKLAYLSAFDAGEPPVDTAYYEDNVTISASAAVVTGLDFGRTWARWSVSDECGNVTVSYFTITVEDQVNPIAVCDEFTTVSIGSDGFVQVFATTFDDGSLDNCGILEMRARKLTNACSGVSTAFGDRVTFCCEEVGTSVMVEFEVTDLAGNKNTCMVEVSIQDKLPPYITVCPADITLDCQADFSDPAVTGEPEYIDNCEVVAVDFVDDADIDNCGAGRVRRTWTVEDKEGFKATCVQTITLEDDDPFVEDDITWPRDFDATTCNTNLDPENLPLANAFPRFDDDNCSLVATVYEDKVFTFVDGACEKILREWTVIDWCTYNESAPVEGEGFYTHLQVIKLKNNNAPTINNCFNTVAPIFGECEGGVTFTLDAEDDCTPTEDLVYSYQIDVFDDGIDAFDALLRGNTSTLNHTLPVGKHTVKWIVEDKCGNTTVCDMDLIVEDGKKPTPYCLSSITTVVMNNNGEIAIWANDFDLGSFDNCTPQEDLLLSFSPNTADSSRVFTCANLPNGLEEELQIELWVTDNAGNQDFCSIRLILQDSQDDVCEGSGNGSQVSIGGSLRTETFEMLDNATVIAKSNTIDIYREVTTNAQGEFMVNNLPKGDGYVVTASKNNDVTNGVSTLDLVYIQRHILGLAELDGPLKVIAADINNDGKLKASDLLSLRKIILGVITEFPNDQQSWRFVPRDVTFQDEAEPFPFPEQVVVGDLQSSSLNNYLTAIKVGDVNGSASSNLQAEALAETRTNKSMTFFVDEAKAEAGNTIEIPVYADDANTLVGYQFTINLNNAEFVSVDAGQVDVTADNFGFLDGSITTSWANPNGVEVNDYEPLFILTVEVGANTNVSEIIEMSSKITAAEAYDEAYNTYDVSLETRSSDLEEGQFALFQNRPNPFLEFTTIKFFLPEASDVELSITDATGRLLTKKTQYYTAGNQNVQIDYSDLNASGVLYYTIKAGEFKATKKMISVR